MSAKSITSSSWLIEVSFFLPLCTFLPLRAASTESTLLPAPRSTANEVQLIVTAPVSLGLTRTDNVTGALAHLVKNVFQQSGFRGQLIVVPGGEVAKSEIPTLEIYLLDWSITGAGNVDCTFSVILTTAKGPEHLGVFNGTTPPMHGLRNAFNRAEAFDRAATDAIDNLYSHSARQLSPSQHLPRTPVFLSSI